jgi:hypothetical protein
MSKHALGDLRRRLMIGGILASVVLIAFGIGSIVVAVNGRSQVHDEIAREKIVGTPDMTPAAIRAEVKQAGLKDVDIPSCSVAGKPVDTGSRARCFASYMRVHALLATGGKTYAEMPRYQGANGIPTNDEKAAAKDPKTGKPVDNPARAIWVTETALSTALNTSYFAEQVSMFALAMGIALLLTGIGFLVLSGLALREPARKEATPAGAPVPAA